MVNVGYARCFEDENEVVDGSCTLWGNEGQ
jgi:hypothetical protein